MRRAAFRSRALKATRRGRAHEGAKGFGGCGSRTPISAKVLPLHLASAVEAQADFFCTCDDRLLKKTRSLDTAPTKVVSPLQSVSELQL